MSETVVFVFARGGSKGLPHKNLRRLAGKSLVARAVAVGLNCPSVSAVYVSTDDSEIAREAEQAGAAVPFMRPPELATDSAPEWLAWQHAVRHLAEVRPAAEFMVALPATAPLRNVEDVERTIAAVRDSGIDLALTVIQTPSNPYFKLVTLDEAGLVSRFASTGVGVFRRQDAPAVHEIVPVAYAARTQYVLEAAHMLEGRVRGVTIPRDRSVDIDTEFDFRIAEALIGGPG